MTYQEFRTLPAYQDLLPNGARLDGRNYWAAFNGPPPAIGAVIQVNMNGLGRGTVTGYFVEHGYLGLLVTLENAPAWHRKQNKNNPLAHIFGTEWRAI